MNRLILSNCLLACFEIVNYKIGNTVRPEPQCSGQKEGLMMSNKRIHIRKDCLVPVRFTYEGQHKTYYARMVNYGDGGLCLKTRTPIEQGAKLELSLEGYSPRESSLGEFDRYPVAVCWTKQIPERGLPVYETGLKYRG